jgi:hypothetical protein
MQIGCPIKRLDCVVRLSLRLGLLLSSLLCLALELGLLSSYFSGALGLTLLGQAA